MDINEIWKKSEEKLKKERQMKQDDKIRLDDLEREIFVNDHKLISRIISCERNFESIVEETEEIDKDRKVKYPNNQLGSSSFLKLRFKPGFGRIVWRIIEYYYRENVSKDNTIYVKYHNLFTTRPNNNYMFGIRRRFDESCIKPDYELLIYKIFKENSYDLLFDSINAFLNNPLKDHNYPLSDS